MPYKSKEAQRTYMRLYHLLTSRSPKRLEQRRKAKRVYHHRHRDKVLARKRKYDQSAKRKADRAEWKAANRYLVNARLRDWRAAQPVSYKLKDRVIKQRVVPRRAWESIRKAGR